MKRTLWRARGALLTLAIMSMPLAMAACGPGGSLSATSAAIQKTSSNPTSLPTSVPAGTPAPTLWGEEVEATEFQGTQLTPILHQGDNALGGTQFIDRNSYRLLVDGLVDRRLALSYADLQAYPQESWLMDLNCVEGWNFTAKWTGPRLDSIFKDAKVHPEAKIAIFHTADVPSGYTSLDLDYIRDNDIIIALKLNDVTLHQERGFPFQVVAKKKYGYKWAKWVTRIELSSNTGFLGYWEVRGFSNSGEMTAPGDR
jgi:DMSO/TMAO reductase YedYZ molybdopterin-dependent catalytic subunit